MKTPHRTAKVEMLCIQHNCARSYEWTMAVLETGISEGADVVCIQEPVKSRAIRHPGFHLIWPADPNGRTLTAIRVDRKIEINIREDLAQESLGDVQVFDLLIQENKQKRKVRLVNVYCQAVFGDNSSRRPAESIECDAVMGSAPRTTIICGDMNAHSQRWDNNVRLPQRAELW